MVLLRGYNKFCLVPKGSKLELVNTATKMISKYKLKGNLVLSIHRGAWVSRKETFHAHLCADVEDYLRVYEEKKFMIPKGQKQKENEKMVSKYQKSYYSDKLKSTKILRSKIQKTTMKPKTGPKFGDYTLLYHPSEVKVGLALSKNPNNKNVGSLLHTLGSMNSFAVWQDMAEVTATNGQYDRGCHICLVLSKHDYG